jgi:DNA topoisomerase-1
MRTEDISELKQEAKALKLSYTSDSAPGYSRKKTGDHFLYYDQSGEKITDDEALKRIKSLVIPPAWEHVWICAKANGHLQCTGVDAAGRKQYKYHPQWSKYRNDRKHSRMGEFAEVLPLIRQQVEKDLKVQEFTKTKVVALAVSVMDKTHIRIGNAVYAKLYGSYGLTSLRNKHIKVSGNKMTISFRGKKGVQQEVVLTHTRLINMLKKLKDIPGQELFQFYDADGTKRSLESDAVNEYIETCTGKDFTAKDFRTWWGTVTAATYLAGLPPQQTKEEAHKNIVAALDAVAKNLGNTRTVCKKYYVHPLLLSYYEDGKLEKYLDKIRDVKPSDGVIREEEKMIIEFMKEECK